MFSRLQAFLVFFLYPGATFKGLGQIFNIKLEKHNISKYKTQISSIRKKISNGTEETETSSTSDIVIELCSNNDKWVISGVTLFYSIIL